MSRERRPPREPVLPRTEEDEAREHDQARHDEASERAHRDERESREPSQDDKDAREQGQHGYLRAFQHHRMRWSTRPAAEPAIDVHCDRR